MKNAENLDAKELLEVPLSLKHPEFLAELRAKVDELAASFTPEHERQSLEKALASALEAVSPGG
ncbi:MAG: hypothetical protein R6T87_11430 [Marinobacter sp.]